MYSLFVADYNQKYFVIKSTIDVTKTVSTNVLCKILWVDIILSREFSIQSKGFFLLYGVVVKIYCVIQDNFSIFGYEPLLDDIKTISLRNQGFLVHIIESKPVQ